MIEVEDLLRLPFFQGFSPADVAGLLSVGRQRVYQAGQVVFGEGLPDDCSLFIAVKGGIRVSIAGKDHQQFVIGHAGEGTIFGEMSFCDGNPRSATVTADAPLEAVSISRQIYEGLCISQPVVALNLMRRLAHIISMRLRTADKFVVLAWSAIALGQQQPPAPSPPPPPSMKATTAGRQLDLTEQPDLFQTVDKLPGIERTQTGGIHDTDIKYTPDILRRGDSTQQKT